MCSCIFYYILIFPHSFFLYFRCYTSSCPDPHPEGEPQNGMTVNGRPRNAAWASPIDLVVREKREEERKRETNLTCLKIEARYERARIQMDTDERATKGRILSSSPLALDEISLHPVRDIFHGRWLQLLSRRF